MRRRSTVVVADKSQEAAFNGSTKRRFYDRKEITSKAIQIFYTASDHKQDKSLENKSFFSCFGQILHPNGTFRRFFDFFTVVWVLYCVFTVPFQVGFDWYIMSYWEKVVMNILDIWFAIDILLNFRTGFISHGTVVMNPDKVAKNYLKGWFLIDFLGTFPFEKFINGESTSRKSLKVIKYFKIPKLLRISRVMKYFRVRRRVYDIFQVVVLVFTFLHFGACIWMLVLNPCPDENMTSHICAQSEVSKIYAESFHLSAAMMLGVSNLHVVGDSTTLDLLVKQKDQNVALIYHISTILMIAGLFLVALLISELNVFVFGKKQGSAAFQRKVDRVNYEMEYYEIPDHLQMQVKAFYDYVWIHQKQYDDRVALLSDDQMSTDLQRKLALHLFKDVISHISIFSDIDDLLLGQICMSLRSRIFLPGDMILHKGDVGKELFIITKGLVEVLRDDLPLEKRLNASPIFLRSGSFFGEIALIMETRRTCSVQAKTVCEINTLDQHTFDTILRENPDFARRMNELVVARQLERSMSKAGSDEVDFQVSLSDMDAAVSAVERNMKFGLERRMRFRSNKSSKQDLYSNVDNTSCIQRNSENSSSSSGSSLLHSHPDEVSQLIEDIALRSTRLKAGSAYDVESHSCIHSFMESTDQNENESVVNDRGDKSTEEQTRLVTGSYNPRHMAIDMSKVHPSILNNGNDRISLTNIDSKLDEQQLLIKKLTDILEKTFK